MNKSNILITLLLMVCFLSSCDKKSSSESMVSNGSATGTSGSMAKYTIMNNYMYNVESNKLKIYNVTDAANPVFLKEMDLTHSWSIETIFANQSHLFFGTSSGMMIYSIASPASPVYVSSYAHVISCDPVVVDEQYAYVTLSTGNTCARGVNALEVIDISDIANPVMVKSYNYPNPKGMAISGDYLYLCDGKTGLRVIDKSKSPQLLEVNFIDSLKSTYDIIAKNNILTVTGPAAVTQYNCSDPLNLVLISKIKTGK